MGNGQVEKYLGFVAATHYLGIGFYKFRIAGPPEADIYLDSRPGWSKDTLDSWARSKGLQKGCGKS